MKNPLLDAIKAMKAKRVAFMVGDADELGLPDMQMGMGDASDAENPSSSEEQVEEPDENEIPEGEPEDEAESMMGRKPFDKAKPAMMADSEGEMPDLGEKELLDEEMVNKMKSSGKKPNGLFARAQMGLAKKLGKA